MKKTFALFALCGFVLISCKKEGCMDSEAVNYDSSAQKEGPCNYGPSITLNGDNPDTVDLGATYMDPGAVAALIDGTSIEVVTDTSEINTDSVHTFQITYTASNEHGSVTAVRDVHVVIGTSTWLGTWSCTNACDQLLFPLAAEPIISEGPNPGEIVIDNMFNLVGGTVTAQVQDEYIVVPQQSVDITVGEIILEGFGELNADGTLIIIDYSFENTTPFVGGVGTCQAFYDK